jgi:hypothetical protein
MIEAANPEPKKVEAAPLAIAEIRIFQDEKNRQINQAVPLNGDPVAFIGTGQTPMPLPNGQQQLVAFNFKIPATTIEEAFAKCQEVGDAAAQALRDNLRTKILTARPANGPAYRPPRRF